MNIWKVILATIVIFSAGIFTGAFMRNCVNHPHQDKSSSPVSDVRPQNQNSTNRPPRPPRPLEMFGRDTNSPREYVQKLDGKLQLTPEQRESILKIVTEGQRRNSEVWSNVQPLMRQIMNETRQRIRDQLTPDQQKQFEELMHRPPRRPPNSTNLPPSIERTNFSSVSTNAP